MAKSQTSNHLLHFAQRLLGDFAGFQRDQRGQFALALPQGVADAAERVRRVWGQGRCANGGTLRWPLRRPAATSGVDAQWTVAKVLPLIGQRTGSAGPLGIGVRAPIRTPDGWSVIPK